MHILELKIDDSIFKNVKGLLDILPKDKIEITHQTDYDGISFEDAEKKASEYFEADEGSIAALLKEEGLYHFKFFEADAKIVYTHISGTSTHVQDFNKLIKALDAKNIKHTDIGIDVIMIDQE